jgi:chromosome segregation ATPase
MSTRDAYIERFKARLDQLDAEIDALEARMRAAGADARIEHEKRLKEARAKRDSARSRLSELRSAGDDAWEDIKRGAQESWEAASAAVRHAVSRFK